MQIKLESEKRLLLFAIYFMSILFSADGGDKQCWKNEVSAVQKAMCRCCFENGEKYGCSQKKILESIHPRETKTCLNDLNHYLDKRIFRNEGENINADDFIRWCRRILSTEDGYYVDMFALSNNELKWGDDLKEVMYQAITDNDWKDFFDNNNTNINELIKNNFADFFATFFKKVSRKKEYIISCLMYVYECKEYFSAFIDEKEYKGCSGNEVKGIVGSIIKGLPRKDIVVRKLSPMGLDKYGKRGLLWYLCSKDNGRPKYKSMTTWTMKQMQSFFFHSAMFYWPISAIQSFLALDVEELKNFIDEEDPYVKSRTTWTLGHIINLVNKGCINVLERHGVVVEWEYPSNGIASCIDVILEIAKYSSVNFQLTGNGVYDLLTYNFFTMKHKEKFSFSEKKLGDAKNPIELRNVMKTLVEYKKLANGNTIPLFSSKMIEQDENGLAVRSIINLLMMNQFYNIDNRGLLTIFDGLQKSRLDVNIDDKEKEFNKVTTEDCPETKKNDRLCIFRKQFGYRPVKNAGLQDIKKNWGKVVFIAVHATSFRFIDGSIRNTQYEFEFFKCLMNVQETARLETYCGVFNRNPYFGEFDGIIENYYRA